MELFSFLFQPQKAKMKKTGKGITQKKKKRRKGTRKKSMIQRCQEIKNCKRKLDKCDKQYPYKTRGPNKGTRSYYDDQAAWECKSDIMNEYVPRKNISKESLQRVKKIKCLKKCVIKYSTQKKEKVSCFDKCHKYNKKK